MYQKTRIVA